MTEITKSLGVTPKFQHTPNLFIESLIGIKTYLWDVEFMVNFGETFLNKE